jgi:hypothetical protein
MSEKILSDVKKSCIVTTLANAHATIENFAEAFEGLSNVCVQKSLRHDIAALSLRGRLLFLRLPDFLASAVEEVFASTPEIMNIPLLDLSGSESIAYWCLQLADGKKYVVHLPVGMLMRAGSDYSESVSMFTCINTVVCAGNTVASGRIVLYEDDIFCAQASEMCSTSYIERTEEDWAEAWAVTAAAGSPTPWYNSIWENDEGQLELGLASFCD